jgi:hypothetical protein
MPNPCNTKPCPPGIVLGLETEMGEEYILIHEGIWIWDEEFTVDGIVCSVDDEVEITGSVSVIQLYATVKYSELEIESITKS